MSIHNPHTDRFWFIFVILAAAFITLPTLTIAGYLYTKNIPAVLTKTTAAGPINDPFQKDGLASSFITLHSDTLYNESLPLNFADWSWEADTNWRSTERSTEGTNSLRVSFKSPWSGTYLHSPLISLAPYAAISLDVYVENGTDDLYLELYDADGKSTVKQSLGWYFPEGKIVPGRWQRLTIPLSNLTSSTTPLSHLSGVAITAQKPGTAFFDVLRLEHTAVFHEPWKEQSAYEIAAVQTRALAPLLPLPYRLTNSFPEGIKQWTTLFGFVEATTTGILTGPLPGTTTGSMAVLDGSRQWRDYETKVVLDWGLVPVFSLLTRMKDDRNFVSCAFQNYGAAVQIYSVVNGESSLIAQTPLLATRSYEWWKGAHVGTSVTGNHVSCLIDGQVVLSSSVPSMEPVGMIGFETWDKNGYPAPHTIRSIAVDSL